MVFHLSISQRSLTGNSGIKSHLPEFCAAAPAISQKPHPTPQNKMSQNERPRKTAREGTVPLRSKEAISSYLSSF